MLEKLETTLAYQQDDPTTSEALDERLYLRRLSRRGTSARLPWPCSRDPRSADATGAHRQNVRHEFGEERRREWRDDPACRVNRHKHRLNVRFAPKSGHSSAH